MRQLVHASGENNFSDSDPLLNDIAKLELPLERNSFQDLFSMLQGLKQAEVKNPILTLMVFNEMVPWIKEYNQIESKPSQNASSIWEAHFTKAKGRLADFLLVKKYHLLFLKCRLDLHKWDGKKFPMDKMETLTSFFNTYYTNCERTKVAVYLPKAMKGALEEFRSIYLQYTSDPYIKIVNKFFDVCLHVKMGNYTNGPKLLQEYYALLLDPNVQAKFKIPDDFLTHLSRNMDDQGFAMEAFNRMLLHAIVVPPAQWSQAFFGCFSSLFQELELENKQNFTQRIPMLVEQLRFLKHVFLKSKGDTQVVVKLPKVLAVPMLHLLPYSEKPASGLVELIECYIPESKRVNFLCDCDKNLLRVIFNSDKEVFFKVLKEFVPSNVLMIFLEHLGIHDYLIKAEIFLTMSDLLSVLGLLNDYTKVNFLDELGFSYVKSLLDRESNHNDYDQALGRLTNSVPDDWIDGFSFFTGWSNVALPSYTPSPVSDVSVNSLAAYSVLGGPYSMNADTRADQISDAAAAVAAAAAAGSDVLPAAADNDVSASADGDVSDFADDDVSASADGDVSDFADDDVSASADGDVPSDSTEEGFSQMSPRQRC